MQPSIKLIGSDFELANAIEVPGRPDGAVAAAAKLLLAEIDGYPLGRSGGGTAREWGRRWFSSGGGGPTTISTTWR